MSVKCYVGVEPEGERWVTCDLHRGMRTCYTKYDMCKFRRARLLWVIFGLDFWNLNHTSDFVTDVRKIECAAIVLLLQFAGYL